MNADWYYVENDEAVGPTTSEDLARRIKDAGQSCMVWTEGMSEWMDATAVPTLSQLLRTGMPRHFAGVSDSAESTEPLHPEHATLSQRLRRELIGYLIIAAYLYVCFGALIFYKATVLRSDGIEIAILGIAIVKALILGKFILVLHALKIGERRGASVLFVDILKKSVLFAIFLIALTVAEEMVIGHLHGRTSQEVLSEMAGGTLAQAFAECLLILLILVPYFTFRGVTDRLGEGVLWKLLTVRTQSKQSAGGTLS